MLAALIDREPGNGRPAAAAAGEPARTVIGGGRHPHVGTPPPDTTPATNGAPDPAPAAAARGHASGDPPPAQPGKKKGGRLGELVKSAVYGG
jgi:hypothetical protein